MALLTVNHEKCVKCGACMDVCPLKIIRPSTGGEPILAAGEETSCINCGHCVAVCPASALSHINFSVNDCPEIREELRLSPEETDQFMKSRRSIRVFLEKKVEKSAMNAIIKTACYAPSGHNLQPVNWKIIYEKKDVENMAKMVLEWMMHLLERKPEMAKSFGFERLISFYNAGTDLILRDAPHIITTYAGKDDRVAPHSCIIALSYLELAAYSRGLGVCWAGFLDMALAYWPPLREFMDLPAGYVTYGSMMIGYPKYRYKRIPARKYPEISWK
ncbi:MAG: nitroreductase family protein [Candidatus Omnitrophota bacterium]